MIYFLILILMSFSFNQKQLADGVLSVVGKYVVLVSDVLEETNMLAQQKQISPEKNPYLYDKVFNNVLENQINTLVVLNFAEKDSSLTPSFDEIKKVLDERVAFYVSRFGSVDALENALGMPLFEFKEKNIDVVEKELWVEKFKMKNFNDIFVTKKDVVAFYNEKKDSLVVLPEKASFSILQKKITPSIEKKNLFLKNLSAVRDSLVSGLLDFNSLILKKSEDPSAQYNNGILETSRGDLVGDYERVAYSLNVGEFSPVVETSFGFHIIKLLEKKGEKIKTQHVLFTLPAQEEDKNIVFSFLDSLKSSLNNDPGVFDSLSVSSSLRFSGFFENKELEGLPGLISVFIKEGQNYSFSPVLCEVEEHGSCFLIYKYNFFPSQKKDLKNSWFEIEKLALANKKNHQFNLWIKEKKENLFVKTNNF